MNTVNRPSKKKRILYLDSLMAFAVISVVLLHVSSCFKTSLFNFHFIAAINALVRVAIPIFFMICGALLIGKSNENFINKRFGHILKPYIFWVIVYFICGILFFNGKLIPGYFLDIVFAQNSLTSPFWFIWCLLGGYLLIPIVNGYLKTEKERGLKYLLILFLIITALLSLRDFFNLSLDELSVVFKYLPFVSTPMLCFLIGYYLNNKKFNISRGKLVLISLVLVAVGYILELYYLNTSGHGLSFPKSKYLINYHLIIESIGIFLFFKYFDLNLVSDKFNSLSNSKLVPIVRNISACSFGIYLANNLIVKYLFKKGGIFYQFTVGKAYIWIPVTFVIIFLITWLLIYTMSRIPILKIGSGFK